MGITEVLPSAVVIGVVVYSYVTLFNTFMAAYKKSEYTLTLFEFIRETYVGNSEPTRGELVYSKG
jgi:hypothetical protein